jgi:hypothetical protein
MPTMSDRPQTICPTCGEPIEPDAADVVEAEEIRSMPRFEAPGDEGPGRKYAFHSGCFPEGDPNYRRL